MHGPTCTFWANLTPFSPEGRVISSELQKMLGSMAAQAGGGAASALAVAQVDALTKQFAQVRPAGLAQTLWIFSQKLGQVSQFGPTLYNFC